jgi:tetratricopeptide (TPR) repeat protein
MYNVEVFPGAKAMKNLQILRYVLSASLIFSLLPAPSSVSAQDLVATEELAGGSSVFVFRESRKRPQSKLAGGKVSIRSTARGGGMSRTNTQIAALAKKRKAAAIAARRQAAIAAANRRAALSNTLTAKAEGFLDNDQTDLAIKNYRDALIQNPRNTRASDGLSNALTGKGIDVAGENNNEAAVVLFDEAVKLDPKNDVAYAKLGAIYDAKGANDKAILNYEKALALNNEYSTLYAPLAMIHYEKGEIAKADSYLTRSESAGIDDVQSRYLRGLLHLSQTKNAEAVAAFDRAIQLDNRFAPAFYYKGQALDRLDRQNESVGAYKTSIEIDPKFTPALFDMGVAYYNLGDYKNAAFAYESVVQTEPKNYQAHANLASTYRQMERYPDANAHYKIASEGIKTADLYSEWGFCLGKVKEWETAVARLETAREISPTAIDNSNVGWAYYNSGNAKIEAKQEEEAKNDFAKAKVHLETAVQQDPKLDAAYLNLGSTHNKLGEFQLAVNILKTVLGFRKDWALANNQLGVGYRGLNDLINAVATFKRVVDMDGNNVAGLFYLGEAYNASGNKKEAKKINDRLKKIDPQAAAQLNNVLSGKVVIDAAKQKIDSKVPKVPRLPRFP